MNRFFRRLPFSNLKPQLTLPFFRSTGGVLGVPASHHFPRRISNNSFPIRPWLSIRVGEDPAQVLKTPWEDCVKAWNDAVSSSENNEEKVEFFRKTYQKLQSEIFNLSSSNSQINMLHERAYDAWKNHLKYLQEENGNEKLLKLKVPECMDSLALSSMMTLLQRVTNKVSRIFRNDVIRETNTIVTQDEVDLVVRISREILSEHCEDEINQSESLKLRWERRKDLDGGSLSVQFQLAGLADHVVTFKRAKKFNPKNLTTTLKWLGFEMGSETTIESPYGVKEITAQSPRIIFDTLSEIKLSSSTS